MPFFIAKPVKIEAHQWFRNGDHPRDESVELNGENVLSEGKIVRFFRRPEIASMRFLCTHCSRPMQEHGWISTLEGGHIVCPGDWIITGTKGENYPCKPDVFAMKYEEVINVN